MNNNKEDRKKYRNEAPVVDEGWWESILMEEERRTTQHPKPVPPHKDEKAEVKPAPVAKTADVDWNSVRHLYANDRIIEMKVTSHNQGGVLVEGEGLHGFVPFSHLIDMAGKDDGQDRTACLNAYVDKVLRVKVIECAPDDGRIIFSERAALSGPGRRVEIFHNLKTGTKVTGTVTNITDFGVFIDLGGVEGLIHISELSWGRVAHPNQIVKIGEQIEAQVLEVSAERCRVALSLKRLLSNPWEHADNEFSQGEIVSAKVTSVLSYGAFARLHIGVEGLIHATEMPLQAGQTPRDILDVGQDVRVRVLHVDAGHQRLGFSMNLGNE